MPKAPESAEEPIEEPTDEVDVFEGNIRELIETVVGESQKSFLKSLTDLLDAGADDSSIADGEPAPPNSPAPKAPANVKKWSLI